MSKSRTANDSGSGISIQETQGGRSPHSPHKGLGHVFGKLPFSGRHAIRHHLFEVKDALTPNERATAFRRFAGTMAVLIPGHALQIYVGTMLGRNNFHRYVEHPNLLNGAMALYDGMYTALNAAATATQFDITARTTFGYLAERNITKPGPKPERFSYPKEVIQRDLKVTYAAQAGMLASAVTGFGLI
jgi:hypothetical protein